MRENECLHFFPEISYTTLSIPSKVLQLYVLANKQSLFILYAGQLATIMRFRNMIYLELWPAMKLLE